MIYSEVFFALRSVASVARWMLSNPPLMSRKSVDTWRLAAWSDLILCLGTVAASAPAKPLREPHWWGLGRPESLVKSVRRVATILLRSLEMGSRRTMMRKEAGRS